MSTTYTPPEADYGERDPLSAEFGWHDVTRGLSRILIGYAVLFGGCLLAAGMVGYAVYSILHDPKARTVSVANLWLFYGGLGILSIISLISYGIIISGKLICTLNTSERHGAKWLMFACMTCLLMGPALNFVSFRLGLQEPPEFKRGPLGFQKMRMSAGGARLQIASAVFALSSVVCFMLFLRAVAQCFEDHGRVMHVNLFLAFLALLVAAVLYLGFARRDLLLRPQVLAALGGAWLAAFLWHVGLIVSTRTCIMNGMASIRSPLEAEPDYVPSQYPG